MQKMKLPINPQAISQKLGNYLAVATATAMPALAFANFDPPDTTQIVTYIGYATAAAVAIGTAKLIPAAAMWLYGNLGSMVKRG